MTLTIDSWDFSQRYDSMTLSGADGQTARTLSISLTVGESLPLPAIATHHIVQLVGGDGTSLFVGVVVEIAFASNSATVTAMDFGYFLAGNLVQLSAEGTPEAILTQLASSYSFSLGEVATTGVSVSQVFSGDEGTSLDQVLVTLFALAGEQTGDRFHIGFQGVNLCVTPYPTAITLRLVAGESLISSTQTASVTDFCNQVDIVDEYPTLIRRMGEPADGVGLMRRTIVQSDGEDLSARGQEILDEGTGTLSIVATVFGDSRLVTGAGVLLTPVGGSEDVPFWIVADSHRWSGGEYTCQITLEEAE